MTQNFTTNSTVPLESPETPEHPPEMNTEESGEEKKTILHLHHPTTLRSERIRKVLEYKLESLSTCSARHDPRSRETSYTILAKSVINQGSSTSTDYQEKTGKAPD
jgi:hypothetical protein